LSIIGRLSLHLALLEQGRDLRHTSAAIRPRPIIQSQPRCHVGTTKRSPARNLTVPLVRGAHQHPPVGLTQRFSVYTDPAGFVRHTESAHGRWSQ